MFRHILLWGDNDLSLTPSCACLFQHKFCGDCCYHPETYQKKYHVAIPGVCVDWKWLARDSRLTAALRLKKKYEKRENQNLI